MLTRRTWRAARRYVLPLLGVGGLRLGQRRRGGVPVLAAAAAVALFFRDPERPLDPDPDLVYAPADGVIQRVDRVRDPWIAGDALRISTFLSILDVHVNRSPVAGTVTEVEALPGRYRPAFLEKASENRRDRLAIDGPRGTAVLVMATGMVARTISRWVRSGQRVEAGQRVALIHFGSRADVLLPVEAADALVRPGARVRAGIDPVARYRLASIHRGGARSGARAAWSAMPTRLGS